LCKKAPCKRAFGRGIAAALVKDVMDDVVKRSLKMKLGCPYIVNYLEKHTEYKTIRSHFEG
jgi:predicted GNAT family acetyltransferase